MKAEELRIGNLITDIWASEGSAFEVISLSSKYPVVKYGAAFSANLKNIKGIPLTEEWLVKFGFKKWGRDDMPRTISFERHELTIFPANSFCDFTGYGFIHYKPDVNSPSESARFKFQFVHQLQNLFFVLTGEELTPNKTDKK